MNGPAVMAPDAEFDISVVNLPSYLEIREKILGIEGIPDRAVVILSLRAFGLSSRHIAQICGISSIAVLDYVKRYDPEGLCTVSLEDRRRITSQMLMSGAVGAMLEITPEKLAAADAGTLAAIATKCVLTAEKLRELDKGDGKRLSRLDSTLAYLDMEKDDEEG